MATQKFDIIVLGSGPGGYPAAIRAAQSGKKVAIIEGKEVGGTCLNRGCIPSKALIAGAEVLERVREAKEFGIEVGTVSFDYSKMLARKDGVVSKLRKGVEGLLTANGVKVIRGKGAFVSPKEIEVTGPDAGRVQADKIIIATGSEPRDIPAFPRDGKKILDSSDVLEMRELPKKMAIIGGGIIGCEFASLFHLLGVEVVVIEMLPRLLPMEALVVSEALTKAYKRKGIGFEVGVGVEKVDTSGKGVVVTLAGGKKIEADIAISAVGRSLNTKGNGIEKTGIKIASNGIVEVDDKMETTVKGIYAIGDIASKWWLAHVATHQGLVAASNAVGQPAHMDYSAVPSAIFTVPEIGTVGLSLEQAKEKGYEAAVGAFPFQALGKSQATLHTDGFAQIVVDKKTGQILGAQVVGYEASALVAEMATAIRNELVVESITETIHAHPTIAEAWLEAALIAAETPVHMPPKKAPK